MKLLRKLGQRLYDTYMGFEEHDGWLASAGIAYYMALSFFPLLMVLVAGLGWLIEWTAFGQDAQRQLLHFIEQQASPNLANQVKQMLQVVSERAPTGGQIGFVVLVFSAVAIFAQLDAALDRIWRMPSDPHEAWLAWLGRLLFQRLKALGMLLSIGGFVILATIAATVASMFVSSAERVIEWNETIGPWIRWAATFWVILLLNVLAFTLIYKALPRPYIRWREAVQGGVVAALLWEAGRQALAAYLTRLNYPDAYGVIGSFLAVMLWAYYASLVMLFGAEYVRVITDESRDSQQLKIEMPDE